MATNKLSQRGKIVLSEIEAQLCAPVSSREFSYIYIDALLNSVSKRDLNNIEAIFKNRHGVDISGKYIRALELKLTKLRLTPPCLMRKPLTLIHRMMSLRNQIKKLKGG